MRIVHLISFHTICKYLTTVAVLTLLQVAGTAHGQDFHRPEYRVDQAQFEASLSGGVGVVSDGSPLLEYGAAIFRGVIQAGGASFNPTDSPALRIDQNTTSSDFTGVGSLQIVHDTLNNTFICSGTVITPNQVLTAGHCFDADFPDDGMLDPGIDLSASSFILNADGNLSSTHEIASVTIHPDFGGFVSSGFWDDLAIVELATEVPESTPKYAIRDTPMTSAEVLELVGYGQSGFGDMGFSVLPNFTDKRSGKNAADQFVVDDEGGGLNEVFLFDFDAPEGYDPPPGFEAVNLFGGGPTLGNNIETVLGGGDSGGPAFVEIGGDPVIAGVDTFDFAIENLTPPVGYFGSAGGGIDVAPYAEWIVSVAPGVSVVPEPTSSALLLTAVLAVGGWRRGRRSQRVA